MTTYSLSCPDNDSHMCGSDDRLFDEISGIPICPACGYKTDSYFINPSFRVKRRTYDLSSTYDGYQIASLKFVEACRRRGIEGVEFISLPADMDFYVIKHASITLFDFKSRGTRFNTFCTVCGFYKSVAGATPAFFLSTPKADLSGTDILFGSGNSRHRMLVATERAKKLLTEEKLKGLEFSKQA